MGSARPRHELIHTRLYPGADDAHGSQPFLSPAEYLAQRAETLVKRASRGARVLFHGLELDRHHAQRKWNERALFMRQLDGPNISATDFAEWPAIEKPLRAVNRFPADVATRFDCFASDRAELDIVQHDPTSAPDTRRHPEQIKQRQRVTMVCVNKGNLQFVAFGDLQNESCIARDVQANQRRKLRKGLWNFETTRACSVNDALDVDVDRINPARAADVPASKRSRNNSCRKAGQRSDFDYALRGENADKRGQEKIIARPDVAGVTGPAPRD